MNDEGSGDGSMELFKKILSLRVGEAFVYAPSAIISRSAQGEDCALEKLGSGLLKVKVRKRLT